MPLSPARHPILPFISVLKKRATMLAPHVEYVYITIQFNCYEESSLQIRLLIAIHTVLKERIQYKKQDLAVLFIRKRCILKISPILKLPKVKDLGKMLHFLNWLLNSDWDTFLCNILPNFRIFYISRIEFHCNIFVNPQLSHLIM